MMMGLWMFFGALASAAKVPATVNIGLGPSVVWLGDPSTGTLSRSVGLSLMAEGYVDRKTLRSKKVIKRVPRQYRSMVRGMPDAHVVPIPAMVIPDVVGLVPLGDTGEQPQLMPVSWAPIGVSLLHKTDGPHVVLDAQPRLSWIRSSDPQNGDAHTAWLGATLQPEFQTAMSQRVGVAVGGHIGAGWSPSPYEDAAPWIMPWMHADSYARLQVRVPIEVSL